MLDRQRHHRVHFSDVWDEMMRVPWYTNLTMENVIYHSKSRHLAVQQQHAKPLVHQPSYKLRYYYLDLAHGGSFHSLAEDNSVKEEDLAEIWEQVEEADAKELAQFVQEKAFVKIKLHEVPDGTVIIDGVWVRVWKIKQGKKILKSRMCARGCFDPQKAELSTLQIHYGKSPFPAAPALDCSSDGHMS